MAIMLSEDVTDEELPWYFRRVDLSAEESLWIASWSEHPHTQRFTNVWVGTTPSCSCCSERVIIPDERVETVLRAMITKHERHIAYYKTMLENLERG